MTISTTKKKKKEQTIKFLSDSFIKTLTLQKKRKIFLKEKSFQEEKLIHEGKNLQLKQRRFKIPSFGETNFLLKNEHLSAFNCLHIRAPHSL